jgi:hypothetical protein
MVACASWTNAIRTTETAATSTRTTNAPAVKQSYYALNSCNLMQNAECLPSHALDSNRKVTVRVYYS